MVNLSEVSKSYVGQEKVLDRVSFELKKGEFVYVVGGSGAGKSTLLRILATEEKPSSGTVSLFGYNLDRVSPSTLRAIRKAIGYVPQDIRLISDLSIYENVALALTLAGSRVLSADSRRRIIELLEVMGLAAKKDKPASALSGGEAQRVAITRALVREPELIIADEPTGAQDRDFTWSLMELFVRSNLKGSSILLATHDREIVRRVRKKCLMLKEGKTLVEEGSLCFY